MISSNLIEDTKLLGHIMKPYGHSRKDKLECMWGCCTYKSGKKKICRKLVDRSNRKTARQLAKKLLRVLYNK